MGLRLASKYKDATFERLKLLAQDIEALQNIDQQLALFHQEMLREFEPRLARLDVLLSDMEARGIAILRGDYPHRPDQEPHGQRGSEAGLRAGGGRGYDPADGGGGGPGHRLDRGAKPEALAGHQRLHRAPSAHPAPGRNDRRCRPQLQLQPPGIAGLDRPDIREVVGSYNREAESRTIANEIQGAFATTALAEAGAIGLGTIVVTVVTGAAADLTGILLATALAVGGLYILPRKRRQAQRDLQRRIAQLRGQLKMRSPVRFISSWSNPPSVSTRQSRPTAASCRASGNSSTRREGSWWRPKMRCCASAPT